MAGCGVPGGDGARPPPPPCPWAEWAGTVRSTLGDHEVSELALLRQGDRMHVEAHDDQAAGPDRVAIGVPYALCMEALRDNMERPTWEASADHHDRMTASTAMLVAQGGVACAWNDRRRHVQSLGCPADVVSSELAFCRLVLTHHHKACEAWEYRRWLLGRLPAGQVDANAEVDLCAHACGRRPRNYYGWQHRRHVAEVYLQSVGPRALWGELVAVRQHCASHLCDASAWDYASFLVQALLPMLPPVLGVGGQEPGRCRCHLMLSSMRSVHDTLGRDYDTGHESVLLHWRHLWWLLVHSGDLCIPQQDTAGGSTNASSAPCLAQACPEPAPGGHTVAAQASRQALLSRLARLRIAMRNPILAAPPPLTPPPCAREPQQAISPAVLLPLHACLDSIDAALAGLSERHSKGHVQQCPALAANASVLKAVVWVAQQCASSPASAQPRLVHYTGHSGASCASQWCDLAERWLRQPPLSD